MIVHLGQGTAREAHLGSWQHQAGGLLPRRLSLMVGKLVSATSGSLARAEGWNS